ncbi:YqaJ viral recombinase family protein [Hoyosella altamirensis]|uniref:YqaJ viral recombinase family protein n=1 Tax=Hoyosella altamirensis TaxID=616997 RepID=UPI0007DB304C|nr:YqaJ viral recombinase family protein [Hoyosella altamirensis]
MTLTGVEVPILEPGSREWLATVSASQVAAIVGASKWDTAYSLWHRKRGTLPEAPRNKSMETGDHWEPLIRDWYKRDNPEIQLSGETQFLHHEHVWASAKPDGIIDGELCLEIKTTRALSDWGREHSEEIPSYYMPQVQWQLFVTGASKCVVLAAGPFEVFERSYRVYTVPRDDTFILELVTAAREFLDLVELGIEPPPDYSAEVDRDVLRKTAAPRTDDSIELDDDTATAWLAARARAQESSERHEIEKTRILACSGSARRVVWRGHELAAFRNGKNGPVLYTAKNLDDLIPELLGETTKELQAAA